MASTNTSHSTVVSVTSPGTSKRSSKQTDENYQSRMLKPTANIAKFVARASQEKRMRLGSSLEDGTPPERTPISVALDSSVDEDAYTSEASYIKQHHPGNLGKIATESTKNFIPGDSRVLVLYASGSIGFKKDEATPGVYTPARGYMKDVIRGYPMLNDQNADAKDDDFITPLSHYDKRVRFSLLECDPLMDSSSMDMCDWVKIANHVADNYDTYDGFVLLHGTDTVSYTAAALSFMLEHIGKTVIITGGVVPLCEPRTDSLTNLIDAITIAGHFVVPEICLYSSGKMFRGSRAIISNPTSFTCYDTPNFPVLGTAGVTIDIEWRLVRQPTTMSPLRLHTQLCSDVALLHIFPGITSTAVKALLAPPIRGVVLRTFGYGNAPNVRKDILHILKQATARGIVVVNTTQCLEGCVADEATNALTRVGVVSGVDMTAECALVKLAFLLGQYKDDVTKIRSQIGQDLRGELTVSVANKFNAGSDEFLSKLSSAMEVNSEGEEEELRDYLNGIVMCNAARSGDIQSIKLLVESDAGWQVDVQDYDSRTPLHIAAAAGHADVTEYLITNGALVHHKDRNGYTPLLQAILCHNADAAATIARAGGLLGLDDVSEADLINKAIVNKDAPQVQLLIKYGADLRASDHSRMTPLCIAVQHGNVEIVKMLLAAGVDVTSRDWWGYTALEIAREAQSRSPEPVCYVYDTIADVLSRHTPQPDANCDPNVPMEETGDTIDT